MRITKSIERWFDVPNDPDKGRLKIRRLQPGEAADISDEVFTPNINYKKDKDGNFEPSFSQAINRKLERELILTKVIVGWENFYDKEGQPLECTPENIIRASREIEGFNDLAAELREMLVMDLKQEEEDQRKNSLSSASEPAK